MCIQCRSSIKAIMQLILFTSNKKASEALIFSLADNYQYARILSLWQLFHIYTIIIISFALSCTLIFMETEEWLLSAENGAWLDCLSVLNEMCLKNKPMGAAIPRTSLVHHEKKSGHIIITRVLFLTVLQLDVRHQSLQQQPREPLRLTDWQKMGCCSLPSCTYYAHLAIPCWTENTFSNASSNCNSPRQINQDLNSMFHVFIQSLVLWQMV